jgi:nitroimidazol reductase NimA-like FMN-containing flavoprotein (pyridoxamine 5'-phosphate oxidase superfamily)
MTRLGSGETTSSLTKLDRDECLELLGGARIARVVLSANGIPVALPVNFAVLDGDVVFAIDRGEVFDAAVQEAVFSVEVDHVDPIYHTGWSVLVTGVAEMLTDAQDIAQARQLPVQPWAPGPHRFFVRVPSTVVTGRRIAWGSSSPRQGPR